MEHCLWVEMTVAMHRMIRGGVARFGEARYQVSSDFTWSE